MKAKRILLCAVSLVLFLLIVMRIVHVNTNVLTIPEERYAQNQWVELNGAFQEMDDENTAGYSVRILGAEQLTYNEFLEKYGASENPPEGKDDIETVLDVEYEFRNVGNSDGYLLLIQYMIAVLFADFRFDLVVCMHADRRGTTRNRLAGRYHVFFPCPVHFCRRLF